MKAPRKIKELPVLDAVELLDKTLVIENILCDCLFCYSGVLTVPKMTI